MASEVIGKRMDICTGVFIFFDVDLSFSLKILNGVCQSHFLSYIGQCCPRPGQVTAKEYICVCIFSHLTWKKQCFY